MTIPITCSQCDAHFIVRDELAGKRVKCPKCSGAIDVGGGAARIKPVASGKAETQASPRVKPAVRANPSAARQAAPQAKTSVAPISPSAVSAVQPGATATAQGQGVTPVGQAIPDFGSSTTAVPVGEVAAGGPLIGGGASSGTSSRRRGARKKQTGMPVWAWVAIVLAGVGGAGGWLAVAARKPPATQVAQQPVASPAATLPAETSAAAAKTDSPVESAAKDSVAEPGDAPATTAQTDPANEGPLNFLPSAKSATGAVEPGIDEAAPAPVVEDAASAATPNALNAPPAVPAAETMSAERLVELATACESFQWLPTSDEQYLQMAKLARLMAWAKGVTTTADGEAAAEETMAKIQALDWTVERLKAIGQLSTLSVKNKEEGIFLTGVVAANLKDQDDKAGLLIKASGADDHYFVYVDAAHQFEPPRTVWVVLGKLLPGTINAPGEQGAQVDAHFVEQLYQFQVE